MPLKVVLPHDEHEVCCIVFLQVDAVMKLLVDDVLQVVVQQEVVVPALVVPWLVGAYTEFQSLMLKSLDRKGLPNQVVLMSKAVIMLVKDALKLVEYNLVDMLNLRADEDLWLMVVEELLKLSMMSLNLSIG